MFVNFMMMKKNSFLIFNYYIMELSQFLLDDKKKEKRYVGRLSNILLWTYYEDNIQYGIMFSCPYSSTKTNTIFYQYREKKQNKRI